MGPPPGVVNRRGIEDLRLPLPLSQVRLLCTFVGEEALLPSCAEVKKARRIPTLPLSAPPIKLSPLGLAGTILYVGDWFFFFRTAGPVKVRSHPPRDSRFPSPLF